MAERNDYANDFAATDAAPPPASPPEEQQPSDGSSDGAANQLAEQRDRYLRLAAEYDNFRKRTAKERQEASLRGQADMLRGLIDALDDIARFAHVDPATTDTRTVVDGVSMVENKLLKTLSALGMEVLNPAGQPFDPALHEAVMTEPAASPDEDHQVGRVFQPGYMFNGQLLRPARVVVKQWNG
jgi:molecular chaperone GrpE